MISDDRRQLVRLILNSAAKMSVLIEPMAEGQPIPPEHLKSAVQYFNIVAACGAFLESMPTVTVEQAERAFGERLLSGVDVDGVRVPESEDGYGGDDAAFAWFEGLLGDISLEAPPAPARWGVQVHKGSSYGKWRDHWCPIDEDTARKVYAMRLKGRKFGGVRLICPDGQIVAEKWLGWRSKSCTDAPPVSLPSTAAQGGD